MINIYICKNNINGKIYVGQTKQKLCFRINQHKYRGKLLTAAINKYGLNNFSWWIVYVTDNQIYADNAEKMYISLYNSLTPNGYNISLGGVGSIIISDQTKEKLKKCNLGKKHSWQTKVKMSISHKGKVRTKEHCLNLSNSLKGKKPSEKCKQMQKLAMKGMINKTTFPPTRIKCHNNGIIYNSMAEASKQLGISISKISLVCSGLRKHTKNYTFEKI